MQPPIPGPKLHPFPGKLNDVEFIGRFGEGIHGVVHCVVINGREFAIKIFPRATEFNTTHWFGVKSSPQEALYHNLPFYRECRAYGRLKELQLEHLATKCYGYIKLDKKHEEELAELGETWLCEIRPNHIADAPLWGIVKEVEKMTITKNVPLGQNPSDHGIERTVNNITIPKMIRNLRKMHQAGIWVRDCHRGNWRDGRLIDFSSALTMPHPYMTREIMEEKMPPEERLIWDGLEIDQLVDWWNKNHPRQKDKIWVRMLANSEYKEKTRTGDTNVSDDNYPYRPEEYDWEAAERKRNERQNKENTDQDYSVKEPETKSDEVGARPGKKGGKNGGKKEGKKEGKKNKKGAAAKNRRKRKAR